MLFFANHSHFSRIWYKITQKYNMSKSDLVLTAANLKPNKLWQDNYIKTILPRSKKEEISPTTNSLCPMSNIMDLNTDFPVMESDHDVSIYTYWLTVSRTRRIDAGWVSERFMNLLTGHAHEINDQMKGKSSREPNVSGHVWGEMSHLRSHEWQIHPAAPLKPTRSDQRCKRA